MCRSIPFRKTETHPSAEPLIAFYFSNVGSFSLDGCGGAASEGRCVLLSKFLEKQKISEINLECLAFRIVFKKAKIKTICI